jgi:hypothetical protein
MFFYHLPVQILTDNAYNQQYDDRIELGKCEIPLSIVEQYIMGAARFGE